MTAPARQDARCCSRARSAPPRTDRRRNNDFARRPGLLGLAGYEQTRLNTAAVELIRDVGLPSATALALALQVVADDGGRPTALEVSLRLPRAAVARLRDSLAHGGEQALSGIVAARRLVDTLSFDDDPEAALPVSSWGFGWSGAPPRRSAPAVWPRWRASWRFSDRATPRRRSST